ncbi:MAG: MotA/TolQ/ExbB proton channel family protein [Sphingobacteriaceae bacterium]|nr:MotA/TolQ/ExbB proton channel family protein [Sphingobacteriaceae bacterium]
MKRSLSSYIGMTLTMIFFMIGALDSFGYYRIEFIQGLLNIPSMMVILGGSFFQAYSSFPATAVNKAMLEFKPTLSLKSKLAEEEELIENVMAMVRELRINKQATIAKMMEGGSKGFRLYIADLLSTNYGIDEIRVLGTHKIHTMKQAEMTPVKVFGVLATASPAYGMLGTLMGLIVMLSNFENASGLANGLALALMTTFYGLLFTQFLWQPIGKKLTLTVQHDEVKREIELEAVLLTMEGRPELYIIDQLSSMLQAREGVSSMSN